MQPFFIKNKFVIEKFISFSKTKIKIDDPNYNHAKLCGDFLESIINEHRPSRSSFDESCKFNIKHIGDNFIDAISSDNYDYDIYNEAIIFLIRIAREYQLMSSTILPKSGKLILKKFKEESNLYSSEINDQIYYSVLAIFFLIYFQYHF